MEYRMLVVKAAQNSHAAVNKTSRIERALTTEVVTQQQKTFLPVNWFMKKSMSF